MRSAFHRFPEVLLIDATHKTNDQGMALYTVINIDGNGQSQVVAFFWSRLKVSHLSIV